MNGGGIPTPAIFLDRDGTLVGSPPYPTRADQLELVHEALPLLGLARSRGYRLVVVTNQSGVARGLLSEGQLKHLHIDLEYRLKAEGVLLDGIYYCPHLPDAKVAPYAIDCPCRKPKPGLLLQAARELDLDLSRSWCVGDSRVDVQAGQRAGCRTALLASFTSAIDRDAAPDLKNPDLAAALAMILEFDGCEPRGS